MIIFCTNFNNLCLLLDQLLDHSWPCRSLHHLFSKTKCSVRICTPGVHLTCFSYSNCKTVRAADIYYLIDALLSIKIKTKHQIFNKGWNYNIVCWSILDPELSSLIASESIKKAILSQYGWMRISARKFPNSLNTLEKACSRNRELLFAGILSKLTMLIRSPNKEISSCQRTVIVTPAWGKDCSSAAPVFHSLKCLSYSLFRNWNRCVLRRHPVEIHLIRGSVKVRQTWVKPAVNRHICFGWEANLTHILTI